MKATPGEIDKYLKLLEENPRAIATVTHGLADTRLSGKPDAKAWSANDILAHLRACADIWIHSIYAMLAEQEPVLPDINERKWAKAAGYAAVPFAESFRAYRLQRENLLRVLKALPFEAWERSALIFGRKHTIFTQMRRLAKHEGEHRKQMESLLQSISLR